MYTEEGIGAVGLYEPKEPLFAIYYDFMDSGVEGVKKSVGYVVSKVDYLMLLDNGNIEPVELTDEGYRLCKDIEHMVGYCNLKELMVFISEMNTYQWRMK